MTSQIDESQPPLRRADLLPDPLEQFDAWWRDAEVRQVPDREVMALSTVDADGAVSSRMVLLRGQSQAGFVFFGNYESRKAQAIAAQDRVALLFFWPTVYRQIRVEGRAGKTARIESLAYFRSRPRASQLGAWASAQSSPLGDRDELHERYKELETRYAGQDVPDPDFWGGWLVVPEAMEFWQGQPHRLHDRFRYQRQGGAWQLTRLAP